MKYYAKVLSVNNDIEEEVVLLLGEREICCFINHCEYDITEGELYLVDITLTFLDDESLESSDSTSFVMVKDEKTFAYFINGFLIDDKVYINDFIFQDEIFLEYGYLNRSYVKFLPDRISVAFL